MNKVAFITGSSRGIGRAVARELARQGYAVGINYIQAADKAAELVAELTAQGYLAKAVQADVADRQAITSAIRAVENEFGPIKLLVNNAGISQQHLFQDVTDEFWHRVFSVNVDGAFHTIQAVLPRMIREKAGCIINISSIWGQRGASCEVTYSSTKAALIGLTRSLAMELAPSGIRVNCVAPGVINTDMAQKLFLGENPIGKSIVIYGVSYKVIGLLDETAGLNSVMTVMSGVGDSVMIPYRNVLSMNGTDRVYALEVYTTEDADVLGTVDQMETYLNQVFNYKDDSYSLIEMENLLDMMKDLQGMMRAMLVGIASISLLVGGIGIMNMMLVSVTERTTEIGLRKALGAEPRRIQIQFLTEAIILSLMGGIMGVIVGLTLAYIAAIVIGYPFELNIFAIVLGTGFSAAVGIIFGFAPAKKASELNPIDALRSI